MTAVCLQIAGIGVVADAQILHPTKENMNVAANHVLRYGDALPVGHRLTAAAQRIRSAVIERKVGTEDGDAVEVLGNVAAAVEDSEGRVIVLDRSFQNLRIIDRNPAKSFVLGRKGSGPLDFRSPMSMWLTKDGTVSVADAVVGVKRIAVETLQSARLISTLKVSGDITSACQSESGVATFRVSRTETPLVEVRAANGQLRAAFGQPYEASSSLTRVIMSEGTIGCSNDQSYLLSLSSMPFIHGYDSRGKKLWTSRLQEFAIGMQEETADKSGRHSIGLLAGTKSFSNVLALIPFEESLMIVQVAQHTDKSLRARRDFESLDTYVVDARDGQGLHVSSKLPRITSARRGGFVATVNDPYPQVMLFRTEEKR
jgi:hypothetical protein